MSRWFKFAKKSGSVYKKKVAKRRPARLLLETLEARLTPATFNVTTLADGVAGSLRAAILSSNTTAGPNTINLILPGVYQLTLFGNAHNGTNGALQIVNQSVTINNTSGYTVAVDGGGVDRVFDIEGLIAGGVTFNGVTIQNGLAGKNSNAGSEGDETLGAGIFSPKTNVTLNNSVVSNNLAGEGGGIWTDTGNVTLNSSTISGNSADDDAGGVYSASGVIAVNNSTITGNVADNEGGGLYTEKGSITVMGSTISGNSAADTGGGLGMASSSTGNLTITNSTITDNTAMSNGGGVYEDAASGTTSITNSTISGNTSSSEGAGLYVNSGTATMSGCTITGNAAGNNGGGIFAKDNPNQTLAISNCNISNNTGDGDGGGIYAGTGSQKMTLTNCTIAGNFSGDAGGVSFEGTKLTVSGCTITGNAVESDGGGLIMNTNAAGSSFTLTNSTVSYNSAGGSQAGIYLNLAGTNAAATITNSAIDSNHSGNGNGGIEISNGATLTITDSSINNNRSGASEAGIEAHLATVTLTNVNVIGNHCSSNNAGLDFGGTTLTMMGCNISDNYSGGGDAGINADGATAISNSTISGNHAGTSDAGLDFSGASLTLSSDALDNNTAGGADGAAYIYVTAGGSISNCTISGNSAQSNAGGLQTFSDSTTVPLTITGCTINNNHAGSDGGGIYNFGGGTAGLKLTNDTLFGNTASVNGGGIAQESGGVISLNFVTIDGNAATTGGGVYRNGGTADVHSTIIAGNFADPTKGPDVSGTFVSLGHNFIGIEDAASTSFANGTLGNQVGSVASPRVPLLGPLQNNGGPTFTQALMPGSHAIAAGDPASPPSTDQRGLPRPGAGQSAPSIGAFEPQVPAALGNTPNAVFVENLYESLLGRTADPGAAGWVTALNNGASPSSVVQGLEGTVEYRTDEIQGLYQTYLHRAADTAGLQHWLAMLAAGGTIEQAAAALIGSAEYFQLHGGTNEGFLTALYWDALGRGGVAAEQTGLLQMLTAGTPTGQVAMDILTSAECLTDVVDSIYARDLGRAPDGPGLAAWVAALQQGASPETVQADILGSGEAFTNRS